MIGEVDCVTYHADAPHRGGALAHREIGVSNDSTGQDEDIAWTERLLAQLRAELDAGDPVLIANRSEVEGWEGLIARWRNEDHERRRLMAEIRDRVIELGAESRRAAEEGDRIAAALARARDDAESIVRHHLDIEREVKDARRELHALVDERLPFHHLPRHAQLRPFQIVAALERLRVLHGGGHCSTCASVRAELTALPGGPYLPKRSGRIGTSSSTRGTYSSGGSTIAFGTGEGPRRTD